LKTRKAVALVMLHLFGLESSALATLRASGVAHAAAATPVPLVAALVPPASIPMPAALQGAAHALPEAFDLNLWTREGDPTAGAWNVASSSSVTQLLAGAASFFVGERVEINAAITGKLRVGSAGRPTRVP
jgi:hypothetical protein